MIKNIIENKDEKRGSLLGNEEQDFRGDSQVFNFFSYGPTYEMKKISCLNEPIVCEVSENPKSSFCSKIGKSPQKSGSSFPNRDPLFVDSWIQNS